MHSTVVFEVPKMGMILPQCQASTKNEITEGTEAVFPGTYL